MDGETAYFAEIVDDEGSRFWSDLIFEAPNAEAALELARDLADSTNEISDARLSAGGDVSLQIRGPFVIPTIPACGMVLA